MKAMLGKKIDIAELRRAFAGKPLSHELVARSE